MTGGATAKSPAGMVAGMVAMNTYEDENGRIWIERAGKGAVPLSGVHPLPGGWGAYRDGELLGAYDLRTKAEGRVEVARHAALTRSYQHCLETEVLGICDRVFKADVWFNFQPFVPGNIVGPVEACYPDEGGYAEDVLVLAHVGPSTGPGFNAVELDEEAAAEIDCDFNDDVLARYAADQDEARRWDL